MYSVNSENPFGGLPMNVTNLMEFGQRRFNPIMGVMNPTTIPYAEPGAEVTRMLRAATNNVDVRANGEKALSVRPIYNPNSVPLQNESRLMTAVRVCEAVTTDDCSAFDNQEFADSCVISHEIDGGRNSAGKPHMGGFVVFKEDRDARVQEAQRNGTYPTFRANAGILPPAGSNYPQRVSYSKDSCEATKRRIACETSKTYGGTAQCGRCEDGGGRHYSLEGMQRAMTSIFIVGDGDFILNDQSGVKLGEGALNTNFASEVRIPSNSEGKKLQLIITGGTDIHVAGYLQGRTPGSGFNRTDIRYLTSNDAESRAKPILAETVPVTTRGATEETIEQMVKIRPGIGKERMNIDIYIPYTFLDNNQPLNYYCPNAPFTTSERSAKFLGTDPCYVSGASEPGQQNKECLQDLWIRAGCTSAGDDYPDSDAKANALRTVNGVVQSTGEIGRAIYEKAVKARLGQNINGTKLSNTLAENMRLWDSHSRSCLGISRSSPCDKYDANGPVGDDCLAFLYNDEGRHTSQYRATYTTKDGPNFASLKQKQLLEQAYRGQYVPQHCTPSGTANPATNAASAEVARGMGSIDAIKRYYDNIHAKANSSRLSDAERNTFMQQCYGITLAPDTRTYV